MANPYISCFIRWVDTGIDPDLFVKVKNNCCNLQGFGQQLFAGGNTLSKVNMLSVGGKLSEAEFTELAELTELIGARMGISWLLLLVLPAGGGIWLHTGSAGVGFVLSLG